MLSYDKTVTAFIASPGDLHKERRLFRDVIASLNDQSEATFEALGWEDTLPTIGRRNPDFVRAEIDVCDIFFLVLHRRWGPATPTTSSEISYTEEEFRFALDRWKETGEPRICVLFKRVDPAHEADPGDQLAKVLSFRRELEERLDLPYRFFDDSDSTFVDEIRRRMLGFADGDALEKGEFGTVDVRSLGLSEKLELARMETERQVEEAEGEDADWDARSLRTSLLQIEATDDAIRMALDGKIEYAKQKFTTLMESTADLRILYIAFDFFAGVEEFGLAEAALNKWMTMSGPESRSVATAAAYASLGNVHFKRGDLDKAQALCEQSIALYQESNHLDGAAAQFGNLATLLNRRGESNAAKEMLEKALSLHEMTNNKSAVADLTSRIGRLLRSQGDLAGSEEMHRRSLLVNQGLGRIEEMAAEYGNLARLIRRRGDLDKAEELCERALSLSGESGPKALAADQYSTLGILHKRRGDLDRATEMQKKSLALNEELGRKDGLAVNYENLGVLSKSRGDYAVAESMLEKALVFNENLGRRKGLASTYGNLGNLKSASGDYTHAEAMYQKSLAIYQELSRRKDEAVILGNLANLSVIRGDYDQGESLYARSLAIFTELGSPMADGVRDRLLSVRAERVF